MAEALVVAVVVGLFLVFAAAFWLLLFMGIKALVDWELRRIDRRIWGANYRNSPSYRHLRERGRT